MAANGQFPYDDMRCDSADEESIMAGTADVWSVCSKDKFTMIFG
jgi:hypothetical protein